MELILIIIAFLMFIGVIALVVISLCMLSMTKGCWKLLRSIMKWVTF